MTRDVAFSVVALRAMEGTSPLRSRPTEGFGALFGEESFIRSHDTTGATVPETDLFVGLR